MCNWYDTLLSFDKTEDIKQCVYMNEILPIYSSGKKSVIFCFALLLPQILVDFQNQGQIWNLLVLTFSKHPLHVQFDQVLAEIFVLKMSGPADFKSVPGFENLPRFVGVIEENKIQRTFCYHCLSQFPTHPLSKLDLHRLAGSCPGVSSHRPAARWDCAWQGRGGQDRHQPSHLQLCQCWQE